MAGTIKVLAIPSHGWNYDGEQADFMDRIRACNPSGYYVINGFGGAADLRQRIQNLMDNDPAHPALELLEIWAHGNTGKMDGISVNNVAGAAGWGAALKGLNSWADNASIYLSGCNTGLTASSVAKALAGAMPFDAGQFAHRITVYGAAGYLYGMNACGGTRSECVYIRRAEWWLRAVKFAWGLLYSLGSPSQAALEAMTGDVEFTPEPGCRNASGAGAYNAFPNWT